MDGGGTWKFPSAFRTPQITLWCHLGDQDVMVKILAATRIESFDILMLFGLGRAAWKLQPAGFS